MSIKGNFDTYLPNSLSFLVINIEIKIKQIKEIPYSNDSPPITFYTESDPDYLAGSAFQISTIHFQLPSLCFFHVSQNLPVSLITLPVASL